MKSRELLSRERGKGGELQSAKVARDRYGNGVHWKGREKEEEKRRNGTGETVFSSFIFNWKLVGDRSQWVMPVLDDHRSFGFGYGSDQASLDDLSEIPFGQGTNYQNFICRFVLFCNFFLKK